MIKDTNEIVTIHIHDLVKSALITKLVFSSGTTLFGLPTQVFVLGIASTLVIFFLLEKILGVVFGIAYFKMMYTIHENDPQAFQIWIHALKNRQVGWNASEINQTKLICLS